MIRQKDFLKRTLEDLGKVLAAALGFRKKGRNDQALQVLTEGCERLVGLPRNVLDALDVASVSRMLNDALRIRLLARLLAAESELDPSLKERAIALFEEAASREPLPDEDAEILRQLR